MTRAKDPREDISFQPMVVAGPKEENNMETTLPKQLILPAPSTTMYESKQLVPEVKQFEANEKSYVSVHLCVCLKTWSCMSSFSFSSAY